MSSERGKKNSFTHEVVLKLSVGEKQLTSALTVVS
jgi:hypothetical protein